MSRQCTHAIEDQDMKILALLMLVCFVRLAYNLLYRLPKATSARRRVASTMTATGVVAYNKVQMMLHENEAPYKVPGSDEFDRRQAEMTDHYYPVHGSALDTLDLPHSNDAF